MNEFDELIQRIRSTARDIAERKIHEAERNSMIGFDLLIQSPISARFSEVEKDRFIKNEQVQAVGRLLTFLHGVAINGAP